MFSQTVEYALRAVVHLANESPRHSTTEQIAEATKVPKAYLSKVLQGLNRSGIVHSQRGIRGGMSLGKEPTQLTLLEVVNAVDPIKRIETCPLGFGAHGENLCGLHKKMDEALALVEESFKSTTLAEMLNDESPSKPLCDAKKNTEVVLQLPVGPGPVSPENRPTE